MYEHYLTLRCTFTDVYSFSLFNIPSMRIVSYIDDFNVLKRYYYTDKYLIIYRYFNVTYTSII